MFASISHPCFNSLSLVVFAKLALMTVGVFGVPTSLSDRLAVALGVSNDEIFLPVFGVGGHFKSPKPSFDLSKLTWSIPVPKINCSSGIQIWNRKI